MEWSNQQVDEFSSKKYAGAAFERSPPAEDLPTGRWVQVHLGDPAIVAAWRWIPYSSFDNNKEND